MHRLRFPGTRPTSDKLLCYWLLAGCCVSVRHSPKAPARTCADASVSQTFSMASVSSPLLHALLRVRRAPRGFPSGLRCPYSDDVFLHNPPDDESQRASARVKCWNECQVRYTRIAAAEALPPAQSFASSTAPPAQSMYRSAID